MALITNNHIAYNVMDGIYSTNPINKIKIRSNFIYKNGYNGVRLLGGGNDTEICDNMLYDNGTALIGNNQSAILVGCGVTGGGLAFTNVKISGNRMFDDQTTKTQQYALSIKGTFNTVANVQIENNDMTGNGTAPTFVSGTVTNIKMRNNPGYNPIGISSVTVTASPFTYTAGYSPETAYITGGTVSSVTKSGITIASNTGVQITLEPNESIIVTYSVLPTIVSDKH